MKAIKYTLLIMSYSWSYIAHATEGEINFGFSSAVSPDVNENAIQLGGQYMLSRYWSIGLSSEVGFGDPKDSLEAPILRNLDSYYDTLGENLDGDCQMSAIKGYDYYGGNFNFGAHPFVTLPHARIFVGVGAVNYRGYTIHCSGSSLSDSKSRLGNESTYNFFTPTSLAGISNSFELMTVDWNVFATLQHSMSTKVTSTTDEEFPLNHEVDDIALVMKPKIGFGLTYRFENTDNKKRKISKK